MQKLYPPRSLHLLSTFPHHLFPFKALQQFLPLKFLSLISLDDPFQGFFNVLVLYDFYKTFQIVEQSLFIEFLSTSKVSWQRLHRDTTESRVRARWKREYVCHYLDCGDSFMRYILMPKFFQFHTLNMCSLLLLWFEFIY